jgi:putative DNA methylase
MAITWFDTHGMSEGPFGDAETLATAKNTAVSALVQAGIIRSAGGKVALLSRAQLPTNWDPATDRRITVWEITQHLIRTLETGGNAPAAGILRAVGPLGDAARDLAYRLYAVCERKGWSTEAQAYNSLVVAWPEISRLAAEAPAIPAMQTQGQLI